MNRLVTVLFSILTLAMSGTPTPSQAYLVQKSCDSEAPERELGIAFVDERDRAGEKNQKLYFVNFDAGGLAINLPLRRYAPDWGDLVELRFESRRLDSSRGLLSAQIRRSSTKEVYQEEFGLIERDCWQMVKDFVARRGITVPMNETGE